MIHTLTLLAPGYPPATDGSNLVLLDEQWYPESRFAQAAESVVAGPGIETIERDGVRGFMLSESARRELAEVESCEAHVLFFAGSDTDVKTLSPIARRCSSAQFLAHSTADRSAARALETEGLPHEPFRSSRAGPTGADLALVTNDWGAGRRLFIRRCRQAGIPTLSLQEATNVDFDGPPHRMRWADAALVQGPHALRYLERDLYFLTGNPRFDDFQPLPFPEEPLVLINCNFIFGLSLLEWGRRWTEQVVEAAESVGLPYRITVHPRDDTDLSGLSNVMPSGAYRVRDQLAACTILVSRDSSLPYEALMLNRHAIYYDPFGEKERCLREDDTGLILKCTTPEGLRTCIERLRDAKPPGDDSAAMNAANQSLFTGRDGGSELRVLRALHTVASHPGLYRSDDALQLSPLRAATDAFLQLTLRPRLRRIGWLRTLWRRGKNARLKRAGR